MSGDKLAENRRNAEKILAKIFAELRRPQSQPAERIVSLPVNKLDDPVMQAAWEKWYAENQPCGYDYFEGDEQIFEGGYEAALTPPQPQAQDARPLPQHELSDEDKHASHAGKDGAPSGK